MLINIFKTFHVTETDFSSSMAFAVVNTYGKGGAVQISKVLRS